MLSCFYEREHSRVSQAPTPKKSAGDAAYSHGARPGVANLPVMLSGYQSRPSSLAADGDFAFPSTRHGSSVTPWWEVPMKGIAKGLITIAVAGLPAVSLADDGVKVVSAPRDFVDQKISAACLITYAQEASPTWCEVHDASGREVGTILVYLINLPPEDRARAVTDCGNQNPARNVRERCLARRVGVSFGQKAFLHDPAVEWATK